MNFYRTPIFALLVFLSGLSPSARAQEWKEQLISGLGNGGIYVEDAAGHPLLAHRAQEPFVPASIIKVATAAAALHYLGPHYRFTTDFYVDDRGDLIIKGYGNPTLLSQELARIAKELASRGVHEVRDLILDDSYFDPDIRIDGVENSSNPYDAANAAILANFNTIAVQKFKNGKIASNELQTPLTPAAMERARSLRAGRHRVNLGGDSGLAVRYAGELLLAFLKQEGVAIQGRIKRGLVPFGARLLYRHESSEDLEEALREMLKFSTNLIANQLFLIIGAQKYGAPATVEKGVSGMEGFLREQVGWQTVRLAEGAGLSRQNRVTPIQMMKLLRYMEPQRELLPLRDEVFRAKTGTLKGVHTYMGYFPLREGGTARFVMMMNDPRTPYGRKFKLAKELYADLNGLASVRAQR